MLNLRFKSSEYMLNNNTHSTFQLVSTSPALRNMNQSCIKRLHRLP